MKTITLNWLADEKRQSGGRWVKEYRRKMFYFSDVKSKSDRQGYSRAIEAFEQWKAQIDLEQPTSKPHAESYKAAISSRRQILEWVRQETETGQETSEEDASFIERCKEELQQLENNFARTRPPALSDMGLDISPMGMSGRLNVVWLERLEQLQKHRQWTRAKASSGSVGQKADQYIDQKRAQAASGQIKPTTFKAVMERTKHFRTFAADLDAAKISEQTCSGYLSHLLQQVGKKELSPRYAKHLLQEMRSFIKWLWAERILNDLPRNLDNLKIKVGATDFETYTKEEIKLLVENASDRTKLYILLSLNCGMLPMDIAELHQSETTGDRIIRQRTKTRHHGDSVPTVSWKLWNETKRLLQQERSSDKNRVFLNENGSPIYRRELKENGDVGNTNNIAKGFERLVSKLLKSGQLKERKALMLLRKTAATMLETHENYGRFAQYFLGQAPQSLAEARYAKPSGEQFDRAVKWLGEQFGFSTD